MKVFLEEYYLAKVLENIEDKNLTAVLEGYDQIASDLSENCILQSSHISFNTWEAEDSPAISQANNILLCLKLPLINIKYLFFFS